MGTVNDLALQDRGQNFADIPTKLAVDTSAGGTVIIASSKPSGRYRLVSDADVFVRQVKAGTSITAADSNMLQQDSRDYVDFVTGNELRAITGSGTANVEAMLQITPVR